MANRTKISAVIITRNCSQTVEATLKSLVWCDEIVIVDSGSSDRTTEICQEYTDKIFYNEFIGFGKQKQLATRYATHDWILSVDSDEVLTPALQQEIQQVFSNSDIEVAGFYLPRSLVFMGKVFKYGKEAKAPIMRLFNRNRGGYNDSSVHETVKIDGPAGKFKHPMLHYSDRNTEHYFEKFNRYSTLAAQSALENQKKTNKFFVITKLFVTFLITYFVWLNILNGFPGFVWSVNDAFYRFVKYLKIYEHDKASGYLPV